jgi:hypothetical protein
MDAGNQMHLKRMGADLDFGSELAMPAGGLLAPLSHEEVTLRRVALGIANQTDLPTRLPLGEAVLGRG